MSATRHIAVIRDLLSALTDAIPVQSGAHAITLCKGQNGEPDRLGLHVRVADRLNQTFYLDDDDLATETPTADIVRVVLDEIAKNRASLTHD